MSRRCPGCTAWITARSIACPRCRPLIPLSIREDLVRLWFRNLWWSDDPLWIRARDAAQGALADMNLPRRGVPVSAAARRQPKRRAGRAAPGV